MTATATYETLTPSGKGLRITDRRITDFTPAEVRALLAKYHWLSFKNHPVTVEEMIDYLEDRSRQVGRLDADARAFYAFSRARLAEARCP